MRWRWMRISRIQQGWRREYCPMIKKMTYSEYRLLPQQCQQIMAFNIYQTHQKHIQEVPKDIPYASNTL
jgi:hypothetical protein